MIELHERLSEFSCGYGVTREVERLLSGVGVRSVPFMPSLLQEKEIGFDVGFGGRGVPLLLQFKLGQSPQRFVRSDTAFPAPSLSRPFWRFAIDTAEVGGQFETLLKAEANGAEVHYIAPRFTDWPQYLRFFEEGTILDNSVMVPPSVIRTALEAAGAPDGRHRVVYDGSLVHVCSMPIEAREARPSEVAHKIRARIEDAPTPLYEQVRRVYGGLEDRSSIRRGREQKPDISERVEPPATEFLPRDELTPPHLMRSERNLRLERVRSRAQSEPDAIAAALGAELWALGIQLLLTTVASVSVAQGSPAPPSPSPGTGA